MKNFKYIFCIFSLLLSSKYIPFNPDITPVNQGFNKDDLDIILNTLEEDYDIPEVSGQITNLPWRNDIEFLSAKERYDTPLLMAAYCAVLKNPLPGESYNVGLAGASMKGIVLKPSEVFSMNSSLGPYTESSGYKEGASYSNGNILMTVGGGVCKIATTSYNLAVLSNLEIVERHHHSMPINYVPYGQDATVSDGYKDFKFKNSSQNNILIWSKLIDNRLYMAFYGSEKPPEITWSHEITNIVEPSTKYIKNENLNKGQMNTITSGLKGASIKSTITIKEKDGSFKIKNMGITNYRPLPKIIEIN